MADTVPRELRTRSRQSSELNVRTDDRLCNSIHTERELVSLAYCLGAGNVPGFSVGETALLEDMPPISKATISYTKKLILAGHDPLGELLCILRSPEERRPQGAVYTPRKIVEAMTAWAKTTGPHDRVIDAGTGSGRFLVSSGRAFKQATMIGIELDPVAALIARANVSTFGLAGRTTILVQDYREASIPDISGNTLFIGNPPYVRHHLISSEAKAWLTDIAKRYGYSVSQLAGLHVYFFLASLAYAKKDDFITFVTASEWLDVNYGKIVRDLFLNELGGKSLHVIEPTASPFPDTATTAVITCSQVGSCSPSIRMRRISQLDGLGELQGGRPVRRERLAVANRWTPLTRASRKAPDGFIELGEICSVHRGQVTGANRVWIAGKHSEGLPDSVLFPSVTKARDLFLAGQTLTDNSVLRRVIDLPDDLDQFESDVRKKIDGFLKIARHMGADNSFIAQHRKAWWAVGLREPAPILTTYMARRPPSFVVNLANARHINIAHGIYPREPLSNKVIVGLASYLSKSVRMDEGRTYSGGLTKFEPKEVERLLVPDPASLENEG